MKPLTFLMGFIILALTNLSAQDLVLAFNAKDIENRIEGIKATNTVTGETASVAGLNVITRNSFLTGPISSLVEELE